MKTPLTLALALLTLPTHATTPADSNRLFDWAEASFPSVLTPAGTTVAIQDFLVRHYTASDTYLGTRGDEVWLYQPATGQLGQVGTVDAFIRLNPVPMPDTTLPDTGQTACYDTVGATADCAGSGQDGAHAGNAPGFVLREDGTVLDTNTGLQWQRSADRNGDGTVNAADKLSPDAAQSYCSGLTLAGQSDWRLPDIKAMYSLIDFSGLDASAAGSTQKPFLDTRYFGFGYGDTSAGEREIDAQWATSTRYVSTTMNGSATMFGVNLADGRIKGYPVSGKTYYVQCVRDNTAYGINRFVDNGDGSITDAATGLMWQRDDGGVLVGWQAAIDRCEALTLAGHDDWRLPDAKALQSIVDYTRAPAVTASAAIDPLFASTPFINEAGQTDWPSYWTSTTHLARDDAAPSGASTGQAAYVAFGRALGYFMNQWQDVHGAGAQRSDPKNGTTGLDGQPGYQRITTANGGSALAHGPQGDVVRDANAVRCVR